MVTSLYKSFVMDHVNSPRNKGLLKDFTHETEKANSSCGDEIKLTITVNNDGVIKEVGYEVHGCAVSLASMSMLSERIKGLKVKDAIAISDPEMFEMMGIDRSTGREKCVLLSRDALRSALDV